MPRRSQPTHAIGRRPAGDAGGALLERRGRKRARRFHGKRRPTGGVPAFSFASADAMTRTDRRPGRRARPRRFPPAGALSVRREGRRPRTPDRPRLSGPIIKIRRHEMRCAPAHDARRHALLLAPRRSDGDDLSTGRRLCACPHLRGTGFTAAAALESIDRSAMPRSASMPTTSAATLRVDDSCTSTVVAFPTTRWLVAINPVAPMEKPDPWVVGVQIDTTLSCHLAWSIADSVSTDDFPVAASPDSTSALSAVSSSTASRPETTSSVWTHE